MIVDKASAANLYAVTREQPQQTNSGTPVRNQESDAGPAVVANLSSAVVETSRAVKATGQASDQNGVGGAADGNPGGSTKQSSVDVVV